MAFNDPTLNSEKYFACPTGDWEADGGSDPTACCAVSSFPPAPNDKALKFCHIFPDESCCLPAQDAEIEEYYFTLLDAGDICAKQSSQAKDALRRVFCFGCDPTSGKAFRKSDPAGSYDMISVCKSLAEDVSPLYYDDCGMVRVAERGCVDCGDDVVVPSRQWPFCRPGQVSLANIVVQLNFGFGIGSDDGIANTADFDDDADYSTCWALEDTLDDTGLSAYWDDVQYPPGTTTLADLGVLACANGVDESGNSPMNDFSCFGYYKFLNDDSGGKPPYFEGDYMVVVDDCESAETCSEDNVCFTGAASNAGTSALTLLLPMAAAFLLRR